MNLNIRQKHIFYILGLTAVIYAIIVGYILVVAASNLNSMSERNVLGEVKLTGRALTDMFDSELQMVTTLGHSMGVYRNMSSEQWQTLFIEQMKQVEARNQHIFALWMGLELSAYVPGHTGPGRRQMAVWHERGELKIANQIKSLDGDTPLYKQAREAENGCIWEPYLDRAEGVEERLLMVSFVAPIRDAQGKFAGVVGSDISLKKLQTMIEELNHIEGSTACVLSNGGVIAAHTQSDLLSKRIEEVVPDEVESHDILQRIAKGEEFSYLRTNARGEDFLVAYVPVEIAQIGAPWSISLSVPMRIIRAQNKRIVGMALLFSLIAFIAISIVIIGVSNSISRPIVRMTQNLNRLADGEISEELAMQISTGDEIEEMSKALNSTIYGLNNKSHFAKAIGKGIYDADIKLMSDRDALGQQLLQMRDNLKRASEEESQRREEAQRAAWANAGHARLGELLRQHSDNLQQLCDDVVSELARYVKVNQVGLFLRKDDDDENAANSSYVLQAAFAWNRKKHFRKEIEPGEGLVGACALERAPIFMTEVPEGYITITSGVGEASPRCVLLMPLQSDNQVEGVLELASFHPLQPHEVDFVARTADSIASTVRSVRVNHRTRELLEQSQMQAEEMKSQEEEMRQNMEELQATQEEIARKTEEISGFVNSIQNSSFVVEYDTNGTVIEVNDGYLRLTGLTRHDVIGHHHADRLQMTAEQRSGYAQFWDDLRAGHSRKMRTHLKVDGRDAELLEVYVPVHDGDGRVSKVMKLGYLQSDFV